MTDSELDRLVAGHLDDALDAADTARLHERLRGDPHARAFLLAAARQATALPQLAARPSVRRPLRLRLVGLAVAASLILSVLGGWLLLSTPDPVLRADGSGVAVTRGGTVVSGPWLRSGDVLRTAERPAVLSWIDEATRIELTAGSTCVVERDHGAKRLRLERGGLSAAVAHQPADGGLAIITPFGVVDVVGTRFSVQVGQHAGQVTVDQGAVAVRSQMQSPPVRLQAGYTVSLDGVQEPKPSPRVQRPVVDPVSAPGQVSAAVGGSEVTARDWIEVNGAGWEAGLGAGDVLTSVTTEPAWSRIMPPWRGAPGYATFSNDLACSVDVSVDRACTLSLVLVVARSSTGMWQGNLQAEREILTGSRTVTFRVANMREVAGFTEELPPDCMVTGFALMSWKPRVDFTVRRIGFATSLKTVR